MYHFIYDENEVKNFFKKHIQLFTNSSYLSFLIIPTARRKYFPELSTSQIVMRSCDFPCNAKNDQDRFLLILRRLEIQKGSYKDSKTGQELPSEALGIYLTVEPLNELKAYNKVQKQMSDRFEQLITYALHKNDGITTDNTNQEQTNLNLESLYKSCLHSSPEKYFKKLDVDSKDEHNISKLKDLFKDNNIVPHLIVETQGGFHVILMMKNLSNDSQKNLYQFSVQNKSWMSIEKSGCLVAIPGTIQAGFKVKIVEW
jgi:hypothetical protein